MKIRNGFVSNSSSTSFIVLFKTNNEDEIFDIAEKYEEEFNNISRKYGEELGEEIIDEMTKAIREFTFNDISLLFDIGNRNLENLKYPPIVKISPAYTNLIEILYKFRKAKEQGFKYYIVFEIASDTSNTLDYLVKNHILELRKEDVFIVIDNS